MPGAANQSSLSSNLRIDEVLKHYADADDIEILREIVAIMLSRPDPIGSSNEAPPSVDDAIRYIDRYEILCGGRIGWITRDGTFLTCGHGAHERLLYWLGIEANDAEQAGWVRVSFSTIPPWQCLFRLTSFQYGVLKSLGHKIEASIEMQKPEWKHNAAPGNATLTNKTIFK